MRHYHLLFISFFLFFGFQAIAQDFQEVPELTDRVIDQTNTLTGNQVQSLKSTLSAFEKEKGSQVVVLLVPTTKPEAIEQYSIRVAEEWKIGRGEIDDGVILLVAINDRKMRIEVGYGLEGAIPDAYAKRIIEQTIKPEFRSGDFYSGISKGVDAIMGLIRGEDLPQYTQPQAENRGVKASKYLHLLFPVALIVLSVGNYFLKKKLGKKWGAVVFFVVIFVVVALLFNFIIGFFISLIMTVFSSLPGGKGGGGRGGGGMWMGGSGFGGGGGSFGGGFSGGGGSFGGGGASGGW